MVFCGQCGQQLPPGSTACLRCGSVTELEVAAEDLHTDDATIVSISSPASPEPQQKLVLRPDGNNDQQGAPVSPSEPQVGTAYAGYPAQHGGNYAPQSASYPGSGYSAAAGQFGAGEPPPRRRGHGWVLTLFVVLLILLLALGITAFFAVKPDLLRGFLGDNITPTVTAAPPERARIIIQQYYQDINKRDYSDAYNFWGTAYQRNNQFGSFAAGYAHTKHDDITIDRLTSLPDGTVKAEITITALEDTTPEMVTHIYKGTYILGQENGAWKFLSGSFNKVG